MAVGFNADTSEMTQRLKDMDGRLSDLNPVLSGRAERFVTMIKRDVFGASQTPWGDSWEPFSDVTTEVFGREGGILLDDTGKMKGLVTAWADKKSIFFSDADEEDKVDTHLFGSDNAWGRGIEVPARPFLPVREDGSVDVGSGPVKEWFDRTELRIAKYVEEGEL